MNREFIFIYEKETNSITTTSRHVRHNRTCARRCVKMHAFFFYAQSPDFHKLGLCYYLKILYL